MDDKDESAMPANDAAAEPEEVTEPDSPEARIAALEAEVAEQKDRALRALAEAENTRRRAERDANDARAYAIQKFAQDLLGVADNLASALAHEPADATDPAVKNFMLGVEMTEKQLQGAFERNGLKRIAPAKGEKFDPHKHQAMMEVPSDKAPGTIVEEMQPGYMIRDRLLRPALVGVAKKP